MITDCRGPGQGERAQRLLYLEGYRAEDGPLGRYGKIEADRAGEVRNGPNKPTRNRGPARACAKTTGQKPLNALAEKLPGPPSTTVTRASNLLR
jgi:hypothetical protein